MYRLQFFYSVCFITFMIVSSVYFYGAMPLCLFLSAVGLYLVGQEQEVLEPMTHAHLAIECRISTNMGHGLCICYD